MAGGRPTIFDLGKAKRICKLVAEGTPMQYAAESEGISDRVLYKWMRRGERKDAEPQFVQFVRDVKAARSKALIFRLKRIRKHGASNWKADSWWIERMFPETFGVDKRLINELLAEIARLRGEQGGKNADPG